jgi:HEAT repeat protein
LHTLLLACYKSDQIDRHFGGLASRNIHGDSMQLRLQLLLVLLISTLLLPATDASARRKKRSALDPLVVEAVDGILDRAMRAGDMRIRGKAYIGYSMHPQGGTEVLAILKEGLQDPQAHVRLGAVQGLIRRGSDAYESTLVQLLADPTLHWERDVLPTLAPLPGSKSAQIGVMTLNAKGLTRKREVARKLLQTEGLGADVVQAAAKAPGDAGAHLIEVLSELSARKVAALFPALIHSKRSDMQVAVLRHVERAKGNLKAVRPLLKSKHAEVAQAAAIALATLGDASAIQIVLRQALSTNQAEQLQALRAIRDHATPAILPHLETLLDPTARTPAIVLEEVYGCHARAGDKSIAPQVHAALAGTDGNMRAAATRWLGFMDGPAAMARLRTLLFDGNIRVRENAAFAIGELRAPDSIDLLRDALSDSREEVRLQVVMALAKIRDPRTMGVLLLLVGDPARSIKAAAIETLRSYKDPATLGSLEVAMRDPDKTIRMQALDAIVFTDLLQGQINFKRALGWMGPEALIEFARQRGERFGPYAEFALKHRNPDIRIAGIDAAEYLPAKARDALLESIVGSSRHPMTRLAIMDRFATRRSAWVASKLSVQLQDVATPESEKIEAARILGHTGESSAVPALISALDEPSQAIRLEAAISILRMHAR